MKMLRRRLRSTSRIEASRKRRTQYCRPKVGEAVVVAPKAAIRLSQPSGLRMKLEGCISRIGDW